MVKEVKMFTVICDNCGEDLCKDTEYSCWSESWFVVDQAIESGWYIEGDQHICDKCFSLDDEDNIVINQERKKSKP